jgi:hypothetical protein
VSCDDDVPARGIISFPSRLTPHSAPSPSTPTSTTNMGLGLDGEGVALALVEPSVLDDEGEELLVAAVERHVGQVADRHLDDDLLCLPVVDVDRLVRDSHDALHWLVLLLLNLSDGVNTCVSVDAMAHADGAVVPGNILESTMIMSRRGRCKRDARVRCRDVRKRGEAAKF